MRQPTEEYLKNPDPGIGGATIPIIGKPGSRKTTSLARMVQLHLNRGHIPIWRGTQQCQWLFFLANDIPVTLWMHESINKYEAYIQGSRREGVSKKTIDLHDKIEIKEFSDSDELVDRIDSKKVNVVNIPGLDSDQDSDVFFFRNFWVELMDSLIKRDYGDFVTLVLDEIGDIFPSQQQLRKPFYQLVRDLPPKLAQLRKNNVWLFCAGHGTHDMHYYIWKIKSNEICYMYGAIVKNELTPTINQKGVNNLKRGHILMRGGDKSRFKEINTPQSLDWIPDSDNRKFRMKWEADIPNLLESSDEEEGKSEMEIRKEIAKKLYCDTDLDLTQSTVAGLVGISQKSVSNAVNA